MKNFFLLGHTFLYHNSMVLIPFFWVSGLKNEYFKRYEQNKISNQKAVHGRHSCAKFHHEDELQLKKKS